MFCNLPQVNQLTALLIAHHIRHIVVCPGSRNATIVHNLHEAGSEHFTLHPVTDERSAAFVALGMSLALQEPTAVCVTSGSALLNCLPAVAEAYYRQLPLLVISADRPEAWIGQLDGQTLPQQNALQPYCPTYQVTTPHNEELCWQNNRQINEAFLSLSAHGGGPAHINVAISEPMFQFTTPQLPKERVIRRIEPQVSQPLPPEVIRLLTEAQLPTLILGQYERGDLRFEIQQLACQHQLLVLPEIISDVANHQMLDAFERISSTEHAIRPDVIVQIGGNFVHKKFKQLLRQSPCTIIRIGQDSSLPDTFQHLTTWVDCSPLPALEQLLQVLPKNKKEVAQAEQTLLKICQQKEECVEAEMQKPQNHCTFQNTLYSLKNELLQLREPYTLHLANSTAVRAAAQFFSSGTTPIYCNRGTNGIEGSLSTAVGYALKMWGLSLVIIGDLSFFYDLNALWNVQLPNNLRIILLNNGHGGVFDQLLGLPSSPALTDYISAGNQHYTAQGLAETFHLGYLHATHPNELPSLLRQWLQPEAKSAQLLEVTCK